MEKKIVELKHGDTIPFVWRTQNLGRAEFSICPIFKRGALYEIWIDPAQQDGDLPIYRFETKARNYRIEKYLDGEVSPWIYQYCQKHKTVNMRVYVPEYSKILRVWGGSCAEIIFFGDEQ